jgi:hypothetical protein
MLAVVKETPEFAALHRSQIQIIAMLGTSLAKVAAKGCGCMPEPGAKVIDCNPHYYFSNK